MSHQLSDSIKKALDDFTAEDAKFQHAWEAFEQAHDKELVVLEMLRESRNAALDIATRTLREEANSPACKENTIKAGQFMVQKKKSLLFHADMLLARIHEADLFDEARTAGAIEVKTEVKYKEMKQFLIDKKVYADFEDCEDVRPLTPAVTGPKPIASFGGELRKK
jgi:hypothetical protein